MAFQHSLGNHYRRTLFVRLQRRKRARKQACQTAYFVMQQYLQLIIQSFQTSIRRRGKCVAVAFTASQRGEGVSYVVESFGAELARRLHKPTLIVDARRLQTLNVADYLRMPQSCYETDIKNLWLLPFEEARAAPTANGPGPCRAARMKPPNMVWATCRPSVLFSTMC